MCSPEGHQCTRPEIPPCPDPQQQLSPNCPEVDYVESTKDTTLMNFFLHYARGGDDFRTTTATPLDSTQWHNYAVEWTPAGITGYIDGVKTFSDTNPAHLPAVAMKQTLQLDWFLDGSATKPSQTVVRSSDHASESAARTGR